jgi:hypothetical protein
VSAVPGSVLPASPSRHGGSPPTPSSGCKLYVVHPVVCVESMNMTADTTINERNRFQIKMNMYYLHMHNFMSHVSTYT